MTPGEPEIGLVHRGLEPPTRRDRHVAHDDAARRAHVPEFDMIARPTVTVDATAKFLATGAGLHRAAAHLAVPDVTDA